MFNGSSICKPGINHLPHFVDNNKDIYCFSENISVAT